MGTSFDPFRDLDRLASALFESKGGPRKMPIDLYCDGDTYVLTADLPGVSAESIDIDIDGQLLSVRAERAFERKADATWITQERDATQYLRQLNLGKGIDTEGIDAKYVDGVLTVTLPVSEKAKPRKIRINTSGEGETVL